VKKAIEKLTTRAVATYVPAGAVAAAVAPRRGGIVIKEALLGPTHALSRCSVALLERAVVPGQPTLAACREADVGGRASAGASDLAGARAASSCFRC
jgi:hypothetical protein